MQQDDDSEEGRQRAERISVPALDDILGMTFACLDDGFVRVVDYLGGDASIVQAARISFGRGTKTLREDTGLIRYLLRHRHTTPFEMCEIKLHVRVPMDAWRQWIRHRTANVNEYSTRYSIAIDHAQKTAPDAWRFQSVDNRQGSSHVIDSETGRFLSQRETQLHTLARAVYEERLSHGVAREQARKDLPLSTYTEAYWKIDLWNLLHFLSLRMDSHAQAEIRQYATIIGNEIVKKWVPIAWQAFLDYHFNCLHLSSIEARILGALLANKREVAVKEALEAGWLRRDDSTGQLAKNREREEFLEKVRSQFGVDISWP